jgi:hypothetical protein
MDSETRSILIQTVNGWLKMDIPATAKITVGPLIPQSGRFGGESPSGGVYLRVYKTKDCQLACIPGVLSFVDDSCVLYTGSSNGWEEVDDSELIGRNVLKALEPPRFTSFTEAEKAKEWAGAAHPAATYPAGGNFNISNPSHTSYPSRP